MVSELYFWKVRGRGGELSANMRIGAEPVWSNGRPAPPPQPAALVMPPRISRIRKLQVAKNFVNVRHTHEKLKESP